MDYTPIYSGNPKEFSWVGFGSGSGTNLAACAKVIKPVMVFSDKPSAKLFKLEELAGVEQKTIDGFGYCGGWQAAKGNPVKEEQYKERSVKYNELILETLKEFEEAQGKPIDLIVLGGYMRLVGDCILEAYKDKIINVHPADLSILNEKNERVFIGGDAVYDAIKAGQEQTRSSVIMVDSGMDHGEIITMGPEVRTWEEYTNGTKAEKEECLREYADGHQSLQKIRSDHPALTTAVDLIAQNKLALGKEKTFHNEWRTVYFGGRPLDYKGLELGR